MLKYFVANIATNLGYEIIPLWRKEKQSLTEHLSDIFARHRIEIALDVGANKGQFAQFLRLHVGFKGRIISFEPIPKNVAYIQTLAAKDGNWDIVGCALGHEDSQEKLNVMKEDVFSSFLKPNFSSDQLFREWNLVDHTEQVTVRRLDGLLDELALNPAQTAIYLKTDTQGYDLNVIAGCGAMLDHIRGLQTEVSVIGIYEDMPSMSDSLRVMGGHNFGLAGLFPVTQDPDLRVVEFDAVFVNNRYCQTQLDEPPPKSGLAGEQTG